MDNNKNKGYYKNCFAYYINAKGKEDCAALRKLYCKSEHNISCDRCAFFQTKKQRAEKEKKAHRYNINNNIIRPININYSI